MTPTTSFKEKFNNAFSIFKWDLRSCSGTLTVFSILATVFTTIILTLCVVSNLYKDIESLSVINGSNQFADHIVIFQFFSSIAIYVLTILFTIFYTIKVYSYLHDKRKADLYGALPISRITLYLSKSIAAISFSLIPAFFFLGIISIISIVFGQPLYIETIELFVKLFIGSISCVFSYGLISVCCGTTMNSIIIFVSICFVYPLSTQLIKGVVTGFFYGSHLDAFNNSFIMNALNPIAAYGGNNIIYWIAFTAICILASCYLVKNRKAERAQSSFAYYFPCHIVKTLIAFVAGMFVGTIFGALNVFGYALVGFVFGFIIASISAYIISHLIFYKSFANIIKTSTPVIVVTVISIAGIIVCNFDLMGYNTFVPKANEITSAGVIDFDQCFFENSINLETSVKNSSDDFVDKDSINSILDFHNQYLSDSNFSTNAKFENMLSEVVFAKFSTQTPEYSVAYNLNNGKTVQRIYKSAPLNEISNVDTYKLILNDITSSDTYFIKYSSLINAYTNQVVYLTAGDEHLKTSIFSSDYTLSLPNEISETNMIKVISAIREDLKADNDISDNLQPLRIENKHRGLEYFNSKSNDYVCFINVSCDPSYDTRISDLIKNLFISRFSYPKTTDETILISYEYENTINVLKEIGVLDNDLSLISNLKSINVY